MLDFLTDTVHPDHLSQMAVADAALVRRLLQAGCLARADAERGLHSALRLGVPLADVLRRDLGLCPDLVARHQAAVYRCHVIAPQIRGPQAGLVAQYGVQACLRDGLLPWRHMAGATVILTTDPQRFAAQQPALTQMFGRLRMAITTEQGLQAAIAALAGAELALAAETSVPAKDSCRSWQGRRMGQIAAVMALGLCTMALLAPAMMINGAMVWVCLVLGLTTLLKLAAALVSLRPAAPPAPPVPEAQLPVITMLVPLYRETAIASHLMVRLAAIRYPRALLDICLVLEQDDQTTRQTLARTTLPGWIRAITVPPGSVKTKPRALNYALPFARGRIIGVWDAEDAPDPDQLHIVARHFAQAAPDVACLQGILDYYNTGTNWLTRCFTIEYAAWFRIVLPGLARLGLVVPLGGTTLFFRRDLLEQLGAWDAHNVTEDADLGLRLARHGYRTLLIPTVTLEEANGRAWPWIKQRARWLKGYAITYGVHMRNPARLLRDLGLWRFFGVQVLFLGTLSLFALMPLFWSLLLVWAGLPHPFVDWLSPQAFDLAKQAFFAAEILAFVINLLGLHLAGKTYLWIWAATLPAYFPLATLAAYRGLAELVTRPFYWDKTAHGVVLTATPRVPIRPPRPPLHLAAAE